VAMLEFTKTGYIYLTMLFLIVDFQPKEKSGYGICDNVITVF
jgi:hypothetical protein